MITLSGLSKYLPADYNVGMHSVGLLPRSSAFFHVDGLLPVERWGRNVRGNISCRKYGQAERISKKSYF